MKENKLHNLQFGPRLTGLLANNYYRRWISDKDSVLQKQTTHSNELQNIAPHLLGF